MTKVYHASYHDRRNYILSNIQILFILLKEQIKPTACHVDFPDDSLSQPKTLIEL